MSKLLAIAVLLLASSTAQAQYTFQYGGHTIRINPDRGTISIPGIYDNSGSRSKRGPSEQIDEKTRRPGPDQASGADPQTSLGPAPVPTGQSQPVPPGSPANATINKDAPADSTVAASTSSAEAKPAPDGTVAVAPPPATAATTATPAQAPDSNSPVGLWWTEEREAKVRIEQCGANLCGYAVDSKSNENGEQVLVNLKLGRDLKWNGRILDPSTGNTYDSTIVLRGADTLRVQGCAFGGMFCGGQTWTRVY